jgi:membrane-associated phospholipid phosphatase
VLAGYAVIVIGTAVARVERYQAAIWAAVAHGLLLALMLWFGRAGPLGRWGSLARDAAPIVITLALYGSIDLLNGFGATPTHDDTVRQWEIALFGLEPSREWWRRHPSDTWSTILHLAYFSFYLVVPAPIALFLHRRQPIMRDRATFVILTAFVICYLFFLYFPVAGPYYQYPRPESWFTDNPPARAVYAILSRGSAYGAAFPSSHVAATAAAALAMTVGSKKWGAMLGCGAALLTVGTVYCQMHYAVDAIAGILVAAIAATVGFTVYPLARRSARDS